MKRALFDVLLLLVAFLAPWWVAMTAALAAAFAFPAYYELVVLGLILDSLYNAPVARFHSFQFVLAASALVALVAVEAIKRRTRFFAER